MIIRKFKWLASLVIMVLGVSCNQFTMIFQEDSSDWTIYGDANWSFSNNELIGEVYEEEGSILMRNVFENFILELEFKPDSTINSGIFIRCTNQEINPIDCYELNIWDLHPDATNRTGAIVTKASPLAYVETINKWNSYKIIAEEKRIQVWINDTLTADVVNKELFDGYIGLQAKGTGEIKFRNIRIKKL